MDPLRFMEKQPTLDSLETASTATPRRRLTFSEAGGLDNLPFQTVPHLFSLLLLQEPSSGSADKTKRLKDLDDTTKAAIASMSSASEMPYTERKRQYAGLGRAINREANPALVAKYKMASDSERSLYSNIVFCQ